MNRPTDEFQLEPGFFIQTDLRVEFDYNGEPDDGLDFGEVWTRRVEWKKVGDKRKPFYSDCIRIDNRPEYEAIVKAAQADVLKDIDVIHDEWVDAAKDDYPEPEYDDVYGVGV